MRQPRAIPDQLSFGRKFGFTMGDYACNLYWQSLSIFLLFYYTDVVGLSAATAGAIYMIASIFDGAIDPFMGAIADRTRSRCKALHRPHILFGGIPLGLAFCAPLLAAGPAGGGAGGGGPDHPPDLPGLLATPPFRSPIRR